jgi:hypothetical protein
VADDPPWPTDPELTELDPLTPTTAIAWRRPAASNVVWMTSSTKPMNSITVPTSKA